MIVGNPSSTFIYRNESVGKSCHGTGPKLAKISFVSQNIVIFFIQNIILVESYKIRSGESTNPPEESQPAWRVVHPKVQAPKSNILSFSSLGDLRIHEGHEITKANAAVPSRPSVLPALCNSGHVPFLCFILNIRHNFHLDIHYRYPCANEMSFCMAGSDWVKFPEVAAYLPRSPLPLHCYISHHFYIFNYIW